MYFKSLLILASLLLLNYSQQPEIIDFTYTQLLQEANYTGDFKDKINISPDTAQLEEYQFPEVCELQEMLNEGTDSSGTVDNFINPDDYLEGLRDRILELLKLAEQMKDSRSYLSEISKHLQFEEDSVSIGKFKSQLQSLARKQSSLSVNKRRIEDLTELLDKKIKEYNGNPKNEQFKSASLNFQIQNCNAKIIYLKELRERSISKANQQPHTNFSDFFGQLGVDLKNQSEQIEFIDRYFQNISHINYLKDMADSLRDNIEVDRLNIQYKKSCQKDKLDIKSKGSSHDEIKETLEHLRQKKKQIGNNTNKYCEGVALKLQMQIKRLLKAVNWTFSCADGLQELKKKKQAQILSLQSIQAQIKTYISGGFQQYQKQYQRTKQVIQNKFQKIKLFTIDQYSHEPAEIQKLITQTKRVKEQAEQKLKSLPLQISGDQTFGEIKVLAEQIKKEKAKFCHQFSRYQEERRRIWLNIYQFENMQRYVSQMRNQFIKQAQKLETVESQYKTLSQNVIKEIQNNYLAQ